MDSKNIVSCYADTAATKCIGHRCQLSLLQMPHEILERILTYLTFDEISLCRQTCKQLNMLASSCLNIGFTKADRLHSVIQHEVKVKLPRRESERRNHALARHVDILSAVETRLSLLSMTYSKYIDLGLCCFIPGKVLDEIYRILKFVRVDPNPPRSHELLQELRDISSMAMEHFDEKIVPNLRHKMPQASQLPLWLSSGSSRAGQNSTSARFRFRARSTMSLALTNGSVRRRQFDQLRKQLQQTRVEMRRRNRQIASLSRKITEQDRSLGELNRRIVDYDQRFDDIITEVARVRAENLHTKQKCMSQTDAQSSSSSSTCQSSLQKQSITLPASDASRDCKPLPVPVSAIAFDRTRSRSVSSVKTDYKKRKGSPVVQQSKHSKTSAATSTVRCLRSGRQMR